MYKLMVICLNLTKLVGTCLYLSELVSTCRNLIKTDLRTKGDAKHGGMGETNADGACTLSPGRG